MIEDIAALILADGKSKRLRKEKAFININGTLLIDKITSELDKLFDQILIASSKASLINRFPQLVFVKDEYEEVGPLAGIHAGLKNAQTEAVFVFACDMPELNPDIILRQCELYSRTKSDVLVPKHSVGIEPLHAIYKKTCLPHIEENLECGKFAVRSFFSKISLHYYEVKSDQIKSFRNINTSADLVSEQ